MTVLTPSLLFLPAVSWCTSLYLAPPRQRGISTEISQRAIFRQPHTPHCTSPSPTFHQFTPPHLLCHHHIPLFTDHQLAFPSAHPPSYLLCLTSPMASLTLSHTETCSQLYLENVSLGGSPAGTVCTLLSAVYENWSQCWKGSIYSNSQSPPTFCSHCVPASRLSARMDSVSPSRYSSTCPGAGNSCLEKEWDSLSDLELSTSN